MVPQITFKSKCQRLITFSLLYLSEGIPLGFSIIALATYMRMQGVSRTDLGVFLSVISLPWAFKWAWAPLVDIIRSQRFGPKRAWIFSTQLLMILTLTTILFLDVSNELRLLTIIFFIYNIFSATQDIAIDALAVNVLPEKERGIANGFMFGSQSIGITIGGSFAVYIIGVFGFNAALSYILFILTAILIFVTIPIHEPVVADTIPSEKSLIRKMTNRLSVFMIEIYKGFFSSGAGPKIGIIFSLLPAGALALRQVLYTSLQVDLGMDESQISKLTSMTTILIGLGCITGGWISDKIGHRKALFLWYLLTMIPTLYLALQLGGAEGIQGISIKELYLSSIFYSFSAGFVFGTSSAVFMDLTNPAVAGSQFTAYMAFTNLASSYTNLWQGKCADIFGYAITLGLDGVIVLIPLVLIPFLKTSSRNRRSIG